MKSEVQKWKQSSSYIAIIFGIVFLLPVCLFGYTNKTSKDRIWSLQVSEKFASQGSLSYLTGDIGSSGIQEKSAQFSDIAFQTVGGIGCGLVTGAALVYPGMFAYACAVHEGAPRAFVGAVYGIYVGFIMGSGFGIWGVGKWRGLKGSLAKTVLGSVLGGGPSTVLAIKLIEEDQNSDEDKGPLITGISVSIPVGSIIGGLLGYHIF